MSAPNSQTVPVEPTEAMLKALAGEPLLLAASDRDELLLRYCAMLAAAPEQGGPDSADALKLLKVADCPACDGSGVIPRQIGEYEWESEQCQWCFERDALCATPERSG